MVLFIISLAEVEVVVGAVGAGLGLVGRVSGVVTIRTSTSGVRGAIDRDTSRVGGDNLQGDIETRKDRDVIVVEVAAPVHRDLELRDSGGRSRVARLSGAPRVGDRPHCPTHPTRGRAHRPCLSGCQLGARSAHTVVWHPVFGTYGVAARVVHRDRGRLRCPNCAKDRDKYSTIV